MLGKLLDKDKNLVAEVEVVASFGLHEGKVLVLTHQPRIQNLFARYEDAVNNQLLREVDNVETEIERLGVEFVVDLGAPAAVADLQIYPSTMMTSFRTLT